MSEELVALVDVVGYMEMVKGVNQTTGETEDKRIIRVQPSEKYESKDRTGQLGAIIEPDFKKIINACQGNEVYAWSSDKVKNGAKKVEKKETEPEPTPEAEEKDEQVENTKKGANSKLKTALKKK